MTSLRADDELVNRLVNEDDQQAATSDSTLLGVRSELETIVAAVRCPAVADPYRREPELEAALGRVVEFASSVRTDRTVAVQPTAESAIEPPRALGHYQILELLGSGGMGTVYRALHTKLGRTVALKILSSGRLRSPEAVARFEREMRSIGLLEHPHVVGASDAGEVDGCHYLAMELVDGVDLGRLASRLGPLPIPEACELARQAALGLGQIHDQGLVHRDIKPSNLMLARPKSATDAPTVKILDLGLALPGPERAEPGGELTATGQIMGTIQYMAPEQALDTHDIDIRADLYGLGATLFKWLTGRAPLDDPRLNTKVKQLRALDQAVPPDLRELRREVPRELAELVQRLLAKSPADRPDSPAEVARSLLPFAVGADLRSLLASATGETATPAASPQPAPVAHSPHRASIDAPQSRSRWSVGGARRWRLGFAIWATCLLLAGAFYWETSAGTVRIESNDPSLKLAFENDELKLIGAYQEPIRLTAGKHALRVVCGDVAFESDKLIVSKGDQVTLRIEVLPGKIRLSQDGKGLLDVKDLPIDEPPAANALVVSPAAGNPPDRPFTLLRDGHTLRAFTSLGGAVAEAREHDVIEIRGNGPFVANLPPAVDKPLHLRSAGPERSRITFSTNVDVRGDVVLEGLDLDFRRAVLTGGDHQYALRNCRVVGMPTFRGASFEARDSVLLINLGISHAGGGSFLFRLENCLVQSTGSVLAVDDVESVEVQLVRNTIYQEVHDAGGLVAASDKSQICIQAEGNIFHHRGQRQFFDMADWQKKMGQSLHWDGKQNLYSGSLYWVAEEGGQPHSANLQDWNKLIGYEEPGSQFVSQVDLQLVRSMEAPIDELRPAAERVLQQLRQRNNLPELGPDLGLVGPGAGYWAWLEQQQGGPREFRKEVEFGGPFTLLSPGKDAVGFQTLADVVRAAGDGDTIEIRQDGTYETLDLRHDTGRSLTVRGGPGYAIVLANIMSNGNDRLTLENLTFTGLVQGNPWIPEKREFSGAGGIHRVNHCQWIGPAWLLTRFVPVGDTPPSIHHTRLTGLHYGVDKNTRLHIDHTLLCNMHSGRDVASLGAIEMRHCMFWNPEPRFGYRHLSVVAAVTLPDRESLTVQQTLLAGEGALILQPHQGDRWETADGWHGDRNLYAVRNHLWGSGRIMNLKDWTANVATETNSREDLPLLADPELWRVVSMPSGEEDIAPGTRYGADVSRIGKNP